MDNHVLHDPQVLILPHPIRVDVCSGEPHDTEVFQHLGVFEPLQPLLRDAGTPTEAILNDVPWMRPVTQRYLQLLGHHHLGSFILTMNRARLRAYGDPILEVTPALQTLLDQTDVEAGLPVRYLEPPEPMIYLRLAHGNRLQVPHKLSGLHECEGAYLACYTLPAGHGMLSRVGRPRLLGLDPAKPARVIEVVIIGSPVGKADALDDASQDFILFVQDEDEPLTQVLERHIAYYNNPAVYSHPGMAPVDPQEVAMIGPVAKALAKVLLYLRLPEAERQPVLERTELAAKLRAFGKLNAKRRTRLALAYDRTLIGPRVIVDVPVPVAVVTVEAESGRTLRPHWRRGHFRRLVGEAGRLTWVRPTLVKAAAAFGLERATPRG